MDNTMDSSPSLPALCDAASRGDLEAMRLLVSEGADVNLGDGWETPLVFAVQSGNLEAVKFLVYSGANVNWSDRLMNPLLYSEDSGNLAIIEFLVSNGADVNVSLDGATPLHSAALFSHVEFVKYLVRNGADVNATDKEGATPLHHAVSLGRLENVIFLLDNGADINAKDKRQKTPLHWAVETRNNEMYDFLTLSSVWKRHDEVRNSSIETVKLLIDQGADLSAIDEEGRTPLHDAVYEQDIKIVEFLSDRGEFLLEDNRWNRGYDESYRGFAKIIRLLLGRGADVNAENVNGETPLDLAKNQLCMEALQQLIHGNKVVVPMPL